LISKKSRTSGTENSLAGSLTLWVVTLGLGAMLAWAYVSEIDQVTRATGQVIASSRSQIIQASDGGVLVDLRVKEGVKVKQGDLLARLDSTKVKAAFLETEARCAGLQAQVARLRAEVLNQKPAFDSELRRRYADFVENQSTLYQRRREALDAEIRIYQESLDLVRRELEMNLPLLGTGDVSQTDILKLRRQASELQGQMTNRRNKYFQDTQAELAKAEEDLAGANQILAQRKSQFEQTDLFAPVDGVVKNVRITTKGGVVRPGEEVMQIVPLDDDLVVEAKLKPADIAFVKPGLAAQVKIDAYDYTIYGALNGTVTYISADTLEENLRQGELPYYRVQIRTTGKALKNRPDEPMEIQPGMTATVEIKTGVNTVLKYLTKPLVKTFSESLGER
jgi:membrane fusion protein, adhesin transport system